MERIPQFCSVCGARLAPSENVQGYDPYSGEPVAEQSLHCTNPTVAVSVGRLGLSKTEYVYHPTWTNENNQWVQN